MIFRLSDLGDAYVVRVRTAASIFVDYVYVITTAPNFVLVPSRYCFAKKKKKKNSLKALSALPGRVV